MYVIHGDTGTAGWGRIGGRVGGGGGRGGWRRRFSVVVAFVEGFVEVLVLVLVRELVNWWWAEVEDGGEITSVMLLRNITRHPLSPEANTVSVQTGNFSRSFVFLSIRWPIFASISTMADAPGSSWNRIITSVYRKSMMDRVSSSCGSWFANVGSHGPKYGI